MKIISGTTQFHTQKESAVAIGKFDGVHKGHRLILDALLRQKKEEGLQVCVLTFDPSPEVFFGFGENKELSTQREKHLLFERLGVDLLVEFPFNIETAAMPPETFVREILSERLRMRYLAAGPDLSFGDKGKGNFELLSYLAPRYGYQTKMIQKVQENGKVISSTLIRSLVAKGQMEEVAECLGAPYTVLGTVRHGRALGRTIDIPTVNQIPEKTKLLPPHGVYYSKVRIGDKMYCGMTNIGEKPTVKQDHTVNVETYLYDFSGDLYGQEIAVSLLTYRRPEIRFAGIEELKEQMMKDVQAGRVYHGLDTPAES